MRTSLRIIIVCAVLTLAMPLLLSLPTVQSQSETPACAELVKSALSSLDSTCAGADGNSACYGFGAVEATFADGAAADSFSQPGSQVSLSEIKSVHALALNTDSKQWGIAVVNVQANVPRTLSAQGLRFILLGDAEIENAVAPEDVFQPADAIPVTPLVGANLRASPSTDGKVIGSAPVGAALQVDGLSGDGAWLRVLQEGTVAWISKQVVAPASDTNLDALPVLKATSRTLMQAIHLRTGTDDSGCSAAPPSMLVVQGPQNVPATITVNGADIRIGSTIGARILPGNIMQLFVISGGAHVGGISVPAGFTLTVQLSEDGTELAGLWTGLRPITAEERTSLLPLEELPTTLLAYAIKIPTAAEVAAIQASLSSGGGATSGPAAGKVDCRRFRLTHPLEAIQVGRGPWYWDGAPGATEYRINFFDDAGTLITSFTTSAQNTTYTVDTGGFGDSVSWNVEALYNGQLACSTTQISVALLPGAQPVGNTGPSQPLPTPTKCGWQGC